MSPEEQLEQLLKASAEARRAEFGKSPKMPNPMRAQLHGEIARRDASAQEARQSSLTRWWPRLTIGFATALILITGSLLWINHEHRTERPVPASRPLAINSSEVKHPIIADEARRSESDVGAVTSGTLKVDADLPKLAVAKPQPNFAPRDKLEKEMPAAAAPSGFAGPSLALREIPSAPPPPAAGAIAPQNAKDSLQSFAAAAQSPLLGDEGNTPAPMSAAKPVASTALASGEASLAQQSPVVARKLAMFNQKDVRKSAAQNFRSANRSGKSSDVLSNFQLEQSGSEIRLVDSDGSTYSGRISAAPSQAQRQQQSMTKRAPQARLRYSEATPQEETQSDASGDEYEFRASGSSQSLKKPVVIEGTYIVSSSQKQKAADAKDANQTNARILGRAKIGNREIEIDAASVDGD